MFNQSYYYKITAPGTDVKTKRNYFWLIPHKYNTICQLIIRHQGTGFSSWKKLNKTLGGYFQRSVLTKADIPTTHKPGSFYSLRNIRAYRATEWVKLVTEYKIMKWEPMPPNPLQHESEMTTRRHYAAQGSESEWDARKRIVEKYYDNEALRQPWMVEWKNGI